VAGKIYAHGISPDRHGRILLYHICSRNPKRCYNKRYAAGLSKKSSGRGRDGRERPDLRESLPFRKRGYHEGQPIRPGRRPTVSPMFARACMTRSKRARWRSHTGTTLVRDGLKTAKQGAGLFTSLHDSLGEAAISIFLSSLLRIFPAGFLGSSLTSRYSLGTLKGERRDFR